MFFLAVILLARVQEQLSADVDSQIVTVADYSVRVENLPPDTTASELKEFFSRWGEVHSTELVKTDCELIERSRIDKTLAEEVKVAVARATKAATSVSSLSNHIVANKSYFLHSGGLGNSHRFHWYASRCRKLESKKQTSTLISCTVNDALPRRCALT